MEKSTKNIFTVNPTNTENMEHSLIKARALILNLTLKMAHHTSFQVALDTLDNKGSTPYGLHSPKSCTESITCVLQIVTCAVVEKEMEHKAEQE